MFPITFLNSRASFAIIDFSRFIKHCRRDCCIMIAIFMGEVVRDTSSEVEPVSLSKDSFKGGGEA